MTPARRRALGNDHTLKWLAGDRQKAWDDHVATLDESKARRQRSADQVTRERQSDWSDWHAKEAERTAMRDNWPTALDFAKENRRNSAAMAAQQQRHAGKLEARDDEQYDFQRQAQMEALAHPPRLQQQAQQRDTAQARQERGGGGRRSGMVSAITPGGGVTLVRGEDEVTKGAAREATPLGQLSDTELEAELARRHAARAGG